MFLITVTHAHFWHFG